MKVYIAARFSRQHEVAACADSLEAAGITVTSRWFRGGHEWVGTPDEEIPVERNAQFAVEDLEDLNAADVLVCLTESPRSGPARGGRHVEFGYALAKGMPTLCVEHRENVFYCLPQVVYVSDWPSAFNWLTNVARPFAHCPDCGTALVGDWCPVGQAEYDLSSRLSYFLPQVQA